MLSIIEDGPNPTELDGVSLEERAAHELLPARAFTAPAFFEAELKYVFERSWVHIADLPELATPGDFVASQIGRVPVLVVRDRGGELRGFVNACRHRGTTLVEGTGNCGKLLRCPYHAWTYTTDGRLTGVPFREEFDGRIDGMNLLPIRVASAGPLVFGCLDEHAPDFAVWAGALRPALERPSAAAMVSAYRASYEVPVNWKVYVENGLDGYHIQFVHDMLQGVLGSFQEAEHVQEEYSGYTRVPVSESAVSLLMGAPANAPPEGERCIRFGSVLPNLIAVLSPIDLTYLRVDPLGPERVRLVVRNFDRGGPAEATRPQRKMGFERTNQQDIDVITRVQRGLSGNCVSPSVHAKSLELRIGHFERVLLNLLRRGLASEARA